jgi:hypothetical protein
LVRFTDGEITGDEMSAELTEDGANAPLRQLPAPGTIATDDLATKLAAADAAISDIQELLGKVRTSHDALRQTWTTSSGTATSGADGPSPYRAAVVAAARWLRYRGLHIGLPGARLALEVDRLAAMRGLGESYSDVILRLVELEARS